MIEKNTDYCEIDLVEFLAYALKHVVLIAVCTVIGLVLALFYNGHRIKTKNFTNDVINAAIEKQATLASLDNLKQEIALRENYINNSVIMKLDPEHVAEARYYFYFTADSPAHTSTISNSYLALFKSIDYAKVLNLNRSNTYLSEIIYLTNNIADNTYGFADDESRVLNMLTLSVRGHSEAEVTKYADILAKEILNAKPIVEKASYPHSLKLENKVYTVDQNNWILSKQLDEKGKLSKNYETLLKNEKKAKELKAVSEGWIKFTVIGAFVGGFLSMCLLLVKFISDAPLAGSAHLEGIYFGAFNSKKASKLLKEKRWTEETEKEYLKSSFEAYTNKGETVAVISSITVLPEIEAMIKKLERKPLIISNADTNPLTINEIKKADKIVFFEQPWVSKIKTIKEIEKILSQQNKKDDGFVLIFS